MIPVEAIIDSSIDPSVIAGLGVVVTMLAGALVLLAKTLAETKQVNSAVNNRPPGEGLFAQLAALQASVDILLKREEEFASKGSWHALPDDMGDAAKLTQTIRDLQSFERGLRDEFGLWNNYP